MFVNARTDAWWPGVETDSVITRVRAYVEAGADGAFMPGLPDEQIGAVTAAMGVPLNVPARPREPSPVELARLGARRLRLLFRAALGFAAGLAEDVAAGEVVRPALSYDAVNDFARGVG